MVNMELYTNIKYHCIIDVGGGRTQLSKKTLVRTHWNRVFWHTVAVSQLIHDEDQLDIPT